MIHKCLSNGCSFDDDTGTVFVTCPVCGYDLDGSHEEIIAQPVVVDEAGTDTPV